MSSKSSIDASIGVGAKKNIAALTVFMAVAMNGYAAPPTLEPPATSMSASIRAQFPYEANPSLPAGKSRNVESRNLPTTSTPVFSKVPSNRVTLLGLKIESEEPVVRLPGFNVSAQRYSSLEYRLDQIDKSISRELSLSDPTELDTILNPKWFGRETAEKRANAAYQRMQVLEMQRIIEIKLPSATPEEKKRLKDEQALLQDLSTPMHDFGHLRHWP